MNKYTFLRFIRSANVNPSDPTRCLSLQTSPGVPDNERALRKEYGRERERATFRGRWGEEEREGESE